MCQEYRVQRSAVGHPEGVIPNAPPRIDLHVHTTASDGAWSPDEVVRAARAGGLDILAVTDHDTTAGVPAALETSRAVGITLVPGVEVSTTWNGREVHILAYFVDVAAPALQNHEVRAATVRTARMETMIARLKKAGVPVDMQDVLSVSGKGGRVLGRPHLARALVDAGHVQSIEEAFDRYLADGQSIFEPTDLLSPVAAVELARAAGGLAVWAHPPGDLMDPLLPELVRAGLRGLEVYRPYWSADHIRRFESIARSAGLFTTGGSDWHSPDRHGTLGTFSAPADRLQPFLEAGGL